MLGPPVAKSWRSEKSAHVYDATSAAGSTSCPPTTFFPTFTCWPDADCTVANELTAWTLSFRSAAETSANRSSAVSCATVSE